MAIAAAHADRALPGTVLDRPAFRALRQACAGQEVEADPGDWPETLRLAQRHRLVSPLARAVMAGVIQGLADDVMEWARARAARNAIAAAARARDFERLETRCRAEGVPVQQIKGNRIAQWAYPDPGARQSGDLDILTTPDGARAMDRILRDLGYRTATPTDALSGPGGAMLLRAAKGLDYQGPDGSAAVDLHWRWTRSPHVLPVDPAKVWSPREADRLTEMFIYLCVHGGLHAWCELKWLLDIHRISAGMADPPLDWDAVEARAHRLGATRWVALALALSQEVFGSPAPARLARRAPKALVAESLCQIAADTPPASAFLPAGWPAMRTQLRGADGWRRRAAIVAEQSLTPSETDIAWGRRRGLTPGALYALRPLLWAWRRIARR